MAPTRRDDLPTPASQGQYRQHRFSRRFRSSLVESDYLTWHFGIWGRRTRWFVAFATVVVLSNLALKLTGESTSRKALDRERTPAALTCYVITPVLGTAVAGLSYFFFSRSSLYSAETHQWVTAAFIIVACLIDGVPRVVYSESIELNATGLCETWEMDDRELASLAASDAASFAYAQCLIMGTVVALTGLRPIGFTAVALALSYIGHRDQNAMSALCFGDASPMPSFATRLSALVGACALSVALNERLRCEFVLQQVVRTVTVERLYQEQEARDWARKLEEKRASSPRATAEPADAEDQRKPASLDGSDASSRSSSSPHRQRPEGGGHAWSSSSDSGSSEANAELAAIEASIDHRANLRWILPGKRTVLRTKHSSRSGRDAAAAARRGRAGTMGCIEEGDSEAKSTPSGRESGTHDGAPSEAHDDSFSIAY